MGRFRQPTAAMLLMLGLFLPASGQVVLTNASDKTLLLDPKPGTLAYGTASVLAYDPLGPEPKEKPVGIELRGVPDMEATRIGPGMAARFTLDADITNPTMKYTVAVVDASGSFLFAFAMVHQRNSLRNEEWLFADGLDRRVDYPHVLTRKSQGHFAFDKVQVEGRPEPPGRGPVLRKSRICVIL